MDFNKVLYLVLDDGWTIHSKCSSFQKVLQQQKYLTMASRIRAMWGYKRGASMIMVRKHDAWAWNS
jgi:hypothetical protein